MGKGDKKTKRGKIHRGTFGVRRPRIKKRPRLEDQLNVNKKVNPKP
ncbi:30S ribosomal protein THX [Xanthomarina spongicola]|uniref:30S ribosomal protein S31 n=1 Tax=Xanthomarina spongicola TaxID=570520 RepID=A0A316DLF2_9FLAO|nr:30S ribosomal protein THX [Xanthomarina spongicola]PWK18725.1 30S ribosomal protein S31 [Xanthomarina spongicola]